MDDVEQRTQRIQEIINDQAMEVEEHGQKLDIITE